VSRPVEAAPAAGSIAAVPSAREATRERYAPQRSEPRSTGRRIAIFCDGADVPDILATYRAGGVQGFTTNPTLMRKAGVTDYVSFARSLLSEIKDLPVSFEVFADSFPEMERQARLIASWGDNVFVKIPVTNTRGEFSGPVIRSLVRSGVQLNVTALLTTEQVERVCELLAPDLPAIVSLFAGRIADTGRDPMPVMRDAVAIARRHGHVRILWASPREVLNVYQAEECGCHIVTATKDILAKLPLHGKDLTEFSRETVQMFFDDARRAGYSL
jgi:transaldolase